MRIRSTRVVTPSDIVPATIHLDGDLIAAVEQYGPADIDYGDDVITGGDDGGDG